MSGWFGQLLRKGDDEVGFQSVLSFAHDLARQRIQPGEPVIDATAGNGNDTLFLARCTGRKGTVYAFDIQERALERTAQRFHEAEIQSSHLRLIHESHAHLERKTDSQDHGKIAAIMFNFGYLPGGDEGIITQPNSSIAALTASLQLLRPNGIITAVLYPGHAGGDLEAQVVHNWTKSLSPRAYPTIKYQSVNAGDHTPYMIAIEKRGD